MSESLAIAGRDDVLRQALTLSPQDRAFVVDALEDSLPTQPLQTPELAQEWSREIDRRIAAYDRGESTAVDFEAAVNHMRQALIAHRESRAAS
ncbi:MAG TPA: addiction module protein [Planctomycetaceae bacterium]|nr:addiction module protein [Planctomycetaceae bacterium]